MKNILRKISRGSIYTLVWSMALLVILPVLWVVFTSLKSNTEIILGPYVVPASLQFNNYVRAFIKAGIGKYTLNTFFVVGVSMCLMLLFSVPGAYSLARLNFKGSKLINGLYIACLFLQVNVLLVPLFILANKLQIYDNLLGLGLILASLQVPYMTFLLQGFMRGIPKDYEYAAMIDGCSYTGILINVVIPMSKPAIVTSAVLGFFAFFNEYILTLVMVPTDSKKTLSVGLANLYEVQRYATDWGALFAGLVIVLIPTVIIYAIGQDKLVKGMNVGGIKG